MEPEISPAIRAPFWFLRAPVISARTRDRLTLLAAHMMFCVAAVTFGFVFWENRPHVRTLEWPVYAGIAATFYASLATTYDFVTRQAARTERWFRGLSTVLLALSILLCLAAMALHESDRFHDQHLYAVIAVMVLFVIWDSLARQYYRRRSTFWFDEYSKIMALDVMLLVAFTLAVKFADFGNQSDEGNRAAVQGALLCILLFMELIFYGYFSYLQARELENADQPMSVDEGYERVADYYDQGNAVMAVEEAHTRDRLTELCRPDDVVVDFGCGTGRYLGELCGRSRQVIAVERSDAMLRVLRKRAGNYANLRICQSDVALPQDGIEAGSVDLVVCCLVIDHLNRFQLQAALLQAARVLKPGGKIYITDVNGYYQLLEKQHAQFVDGSGRLRTIRVYPHTIPEVLDALKKTGFDVEVREAPVCDVHAKYGDVLQSIEAFPLITEYLGTKCCGESLEKTGGV